MNIQQIRNATKSLNMGERKFWSTPCWERKAACLLSPLVEINTCATLIPEDGETVEYL